MELHFCLASHVTRRRTNRKFNLRTNAVVSKLFTMSVVPVALKSSTETMDRPVFGENHFCECSPVATAQILLNSHQPLQMV
jgi:hypothetical protein